MLVAFDEGDFDQIGFVFLLLFEYVFYNYLTPITTELLSRLPSGSRTLLRTCWLRISTSPPAAPSTRPSLICSRSLTRRPALTTLLVPMVLSWATALTPSTFATPPRFKSLVAAVLSRSLIRRTSLYLRLLPALLFV